MKRCFQCGLVILVSFIVGCKSYSKYTIDEKPLIKIDTGLLGVWKAVEEPDKKNFILIQNNYDVMEQNHQAMSRFDSADMEYSIRATYGNNYPYYNEIKNCSYFITDMDMHGQRRYYQQFYGFLSGIGASMFLNETYNYVPKGADGNYRSNDGVKGYFFIRLLKVNAKHDRITTAIVADTTLKYLRNSAEVRSRIEKNINNPAFYSDTLHWYKVSSYHESLNESVKRAN